MSPVVISDNQQSELNSIPITITHTNRFDSDNYLTQPTDIEYVGDILLLPKPDNITRIMTQNVHHLNIDEVNDDLDLLFCFQTQHQIDILGIQEHKLDTKQFNVRRAFANSARKNLNQHIIELGSSNSKAEKTYKPGGTAVFAQGDVVGRMLNHGSDPYGRWSYVTLKGMNGRCITIISAYQVCKAPTNKFGNTAFHQQQTAFLLEQRKSVNPRINFKYDIIKYIKQLQQLNHWVILSGDFNQHIQISKGTLDSIITQCQLMDPWRHKHKEIDEPRTYNRGKIRLDYILVSPQIAQSITAVGYCPFNETLRSDHRAMYLDLDTHKLFGNNTSKLQQGHRRDFYSTPENDKKYVKAAAAHAEANNLFNRLDALVNQDTPNHELIEKLDELLGECCALGAKACKKYRIDPYTSYINKLRRYRRHLIKILKYLKSKDILLYLSTLQSELASIYPTKKFTVNKQSVEIALKETKSAISEYHKDAKRRRQEELLEKENHAHELNEFEKAQAIHRIAKHERRNDTYVMMSFVRGKYKKSALSTISIPESWPDPDVITETSSLDDAKQWDEEKKRFRSVTLPAEIEFYLMQRNKRHFSQAEGTPFTRPPLSDCLNWEASTSTAELILNGNFSNKELHDVAQLLIKHCKAPVPLDSIAPKMTMGEMLGRYRKWSEKTTTSPSGRHLGHYKCLLNEIKDKDEEKEVTLNMDRRLLLEAHLDIINYCTRWGYSLRRWQNIINVMIQKVPGNNKINKLRVIHLFEADYNLLLSVKWRQLLAFADKHKVFNQGQRGSRPGCEASDLPFLEDLKIEISHLTRRPFINLDVDAASCFDRIVLPLASLINRKFGMHRSLVLVHARTLKEARYRLKTELGVSDTEYTQSVLYPLHGTGQGAGNSPHIWGLISGTLFDCQQERAYGVQFVSPDRTVNVTIHMIGFVDDSSLSVNDFLSPEPASIDVLLKKMQYDGQLWNDLLWCSGGMLELPKCSYHYLYFDFLPDGSIKPRKGTFGPTLWVNSPLYGQTPIKQLSVYDPHKTLGHYKSPAGENKVQLQKITTKLNQVAQQITASPATREQANICYHTIYLPSIYVLPNCHYSEKRLNQAERQSIPSLISKMGYNRNTHRSLMYGPTEQAGGGLIRWYWLQGEGQILTFLKHWRTQGVIGDALRVAVAWFQHNSGSGIPLFQYPEIPINYTDSRWLASLRQFLSRINGKFILDKNFVPSLQRIGDRFIMDIARDSNWFSEKEMGFLNACRLYYNVVTISDICLPTALWFQIWTGEKQTYPASQNTILHTNRLHNFFTGLTGDDSLI